jgi:LPXTG-site transpeptidase (sortase) family protein
MTRFKRLALAAGVLLVLAVATGGVLVFKGSSEPQAGSELGVQISESSFITEETPKEATSAPKADAVQPAIPPQRSSRLVIPRLNIDAATVVLGLDSKGAMESPKGPMEVGWYNFSSKANGGGNIVMAGHVDYRNFGPAVFARLKELQSGDAVQLLLADDSVATYRVTSVSLYSASNAPVQQIVGKTPQETITLITCEGTFDSRTNQYDKRLIVRAVRSA